MAAGKGTRMKSRTPKVLQKLAGRALLRPCAGHGCAAAGALGRGDYRPWCCRSGSSHRQAQRALTANLDLKFVRQEPQLGTGHAVQQAVPALARRRHGRSCSRAMCR